MVYDKIIEWGWYLGREWKDMYVNKLMIFFLKSIDRNIKFIYRLLYVVFIEVWSCECFWLLSEELEDKKLVSFYRKFMISEVSYYIMFLNFVRKYGNRKEVDKKW